MTSICDAFSPQGVEWTWMTSSVWTLLLDGGRSLIWTSSCRALLGALHHHLRHHQLQLRCRNCSWNFSHLLSLNEPGAGEFWTVSPHPGNINLICLFLHIFMLLFTHERVEQTSSSSHRSPSWFVENLSVYKDSNGPGLAGVPVSECTVYGGT